MSRRMMAMVMAAALGALQLGLTPTLQAQAPREGITVHGHWVIEVHESDGSLVSHTEFENALTAGAGLLGRLLVREATMGKWSIFLPSGPCQTLVQSSYCYVQEPGVVNPGGAGATFSTLQIGSSATGVVLQGSFTATRTNPITRVETHALSCGPGVAAQSCNGTSETNFTGTDLPSPVPVSSGQIVQISVTLTFS